MRNLEYREETDGTRTMGYPYRVCWMEAGEELSDFLQQLRKSEAAGSMAVELSAASGIFGSPQEAEPESTVISCVNVRVSTKGTAEYLYRLREIACRDVCAALSACGFAWQKARFDDEGTVGSMPVRGYRFLSRCCENMPLDERGGIPCTAEIPEKGGFPAEKLKAILTAAPGSGLSLEFSPALLSCPETKWVRGCLERLREGNTGELAPVLARYENLERAPLYFFTAAVWGSGAEELMACLEDAYPGSFSEQSFLRPFPELYEAVTGNPWLLRDTLCRSGAARYSGLPALPWLLTAEEAGRFFGGAHRGKTAEADGLTEKELAYLGIEKGEELKLTGRQLSVFKSMLGQLRAMAFFQGTPVEKDNYLPYVFMLGVFYELLMKECYHEQIYQPYCRYTQNIDGGDPAETALVCYENGPPGLTGAAAAAWRWNTMAQELSRHVRFGSERWTQGRWYRLFQDMQWIRKFRNRVHVLDRTSGELNRVDLDMATEEIKRMLYGRDSLMRRLLACRYAEADFGGDRMGKP